jgi:hypothetical protein
MKLDDLLEKVPPLLRPICAKYGPGLAAMTAEEFCGWLEMLIGGRTDEAWGAVIEKLDDAQLLDAWQRLGEQWGEANTRNAERLAFQREAAMAVLKVLLGASLALVGL